MSFHKMNLFLVNVNLMNRNINLPHFGMKLL
jgi:hypothetical protein